MVVTVVPSPTSIDCTVLDHAWTIASTTWEHLKSGWKGTPEDLSQKTRLDCDRQEDLENGGYCSATWRTLRALQKVHGAEEIWGCTCVTAPPFFTQVDTPAGSISDKTAAENNVRSTGKSVVIIWDGLNAGEREKREQWTG